MMNMEYFIGKPVIIRSNMSGVHFGILEEAEGNVVRLSRSRRLWRWDASPHGISLSEIALYGATGNRSRISSEIPMIIVHDVIEILPATKESASVIYGAEVSR